VMASRRCREPLENRAADEQCWRSGLDGAVEGVESGMEPAQARMVVPGARSLLCLGRLAVEHMPSLMCDCHLLRKQQQPDNRHSENETVRPVHCVFM